MKINKILVLAFFVVAVTGCKKKQSVVNPHNPAEVAALEVPDDNKESGPVSDEKIVLSPEERAAKTGFAKYLPEDTEMYLSVYQAQDSFEKLKALKLIGVINQVVDENQDRVDMRMRIGDEEFLEEELEFEIQRGGDKIEGGEDEQGDEDDFAGELPDDDLVEEPSFWSLLGREVSIGLGNTSGQQLGNLLKLNDRLTHFQAVAIGKTVLKMIRDGNSEDALMALRDLGEEAYFNVLKDAESGIPLLEKMTMPPIYVAFRAKEGELDQAAQLVSSSMGFIAMVGELVEPVEFETAGAKFVGYKLIGDRLMEMLAIDRVDLEDIVDPEKVDALLATIAMKNLVIASGTIGDYVVVMIGDDEANMKLVSDVSQSLGASEKMNFVDQFSDKPLVSVSFGEQEALKAMVDKVGGLATYAMGFREGIAGGNMNDIEELLLLFNEREKSLLGLASTSASSMVAYLDEGFKIDSFGGQDSGLINWGGTTRLAHLGDNPDNLFYLNYSTNAAYTEEMSSYLELMAETAYALAFKLSAVRVDDLVLNEMKQYLEVFDQSFRDDLLGMYQTIAGDMMDGMGQETLFIADMKGAMPAIPGLAQEIVDEGRVPRLAMISPVTDRTKLKNAWDKMNTHSTSLFAKLSELSGTEIPMQKPMSSETDGLTTWYISMPFFQDNFVPSVTLSDEWFCASTSKVQAIDLIKQANTGGKSGQGVKMKINFNVFSQYAEDMLKVYEKNVDMIIKDEAERKFFDNYKATVFSVIDATREFDSMSWDVSKEEGVVHSRIHFKMK